MEINSTLTAENIEQQAIFEKPLNRLSFWQGLGVALKFLGIQILVMIPIMIAAYAIYGMDNQEATNNLTNGLGMTFGFSIGAWFLYKQRGLIATAFKWEMSFLKLIPIGFILVFCVSYIVGESMTYMPGYEAIVALYKEVFANIDPIFMFLGVVLIGPICEEIVFRGIILEGLLKNYSTQKAIVFSAAIFGLIHFIPIQVINAFFMGIVLGWIYLKTRSLWVCIALHVLNNGLSVLMGDESTESTRAMIGNDGLYIASFAAAALVAYLAYRGFQKVNEPAITIEESIQA